MSQLREENREGKTSMQKIFEKFAMLVCWGKYKDQLKTPEDAGVLSVEPVWNNELNKWQVALTFETKTGITPIATFLTETEARKLELAKTEGRVTLVDAFYESIEDNLDKYFPKGEYNIKGWDKSIRLDEFKNGVSDFV
tara:strand:- start:595 stop:1011 length:417 start_codon:yes stop_codon:yes gene_type:complete